MLFSNIETQPELILTDVFSGESDNLLTRLIESSLELSGNLIEVHDLQDYLYQRLIPYLNTLPLFRGKELLYQSDSYPAPIHVLEGERLIGMLNIFESKYIVIPHGELKEEELLLQELEQEFDENTEMIKKYEEYMTNPTSYGDSALKKIQVAMRKNHYEKEIKEKYQQFVEFSLELEQSIIAQRVRLERIQAKFQPYEDMQYEIANHFRDNYKYVIEREQ